MKLQALGSEIRRRRLSTGWTQADLAEKASVSSSLVSLLELGAPARPSSIRLVAEALGCAISDIAEIVEPESVRV